MNKKVIPIEPSPVHEIPLRFIVERHAAFFERFEHRIGGRFDIDSQIFVGPNETECL